MNFIKKDKLSGSHHVENQSVISEYNRQKAFRQVEKDRESTITNCILGGGFMYR